jgi:hypothetical protein
VYNNIKKGETKMAKIALCGYGSKGQGVGKGGGYAYVVNDNVKSGDNIQVISTSSKGNKFATTAKTLTKKDAEELSQKSGVKVESGVLKENSVKGQELLGKTRSAMAKKQGINLDETPYDQLSTEQKSKLEITQSYTGKEVGATGSTATKPLGDGHRTISEYAQQTRGGNLAMYKQQNPNATFTDKAQETYESYSKQFMGDE